MFSKGDVSTALTTSNVYVRAGYQLTMERNGGVLAAVVRRRVTAMCQECHARLIGMHLTIFERIFAVRTVRIPVGGAPTMLEFPRRSPRLITPSPK
ncbi:hypothetical protein Trydic_g5870 [Trypoxylus dichotomus]